MFGNLVATLCIWFASGLGLGSGLWFGLRLLVKAVYVFRIGFEW